MSQPSSSLNSNNPFRRKPSGAPTPQSSLNLPVSAEAYSSSGLAVANPSSPATTGLPPSGDQFRSQLQALSQPTQPAPVTTFQKPKVVKKVRVQSPPPSSPESAGIPDHYAPAGRGEEGGDDDDESSLTNEEEEEDDDDDDDDDDDGNDIRDPFSNSPLRTPLGGGDNLARSASVPLQKTPPNPFQKTLQDLEGDTRVVTNDDSIVAGALGGKGILDVDAFKRLLLTGQSGGPSSSVDASIPPIEPPSTQQATQPVPLAGDAASIADTSSASRQSLLDTQDTPRTSHEISEPEPEADQRSLTSKPHAKRPPPVVAARRHGKLINVELKTRGAPASEDTTGPSSSSARSVRENTAFSSPSSPTQQRPVTSSDVNKPLPPAPLGLHPGEDAESIFDREAAGKVPELDTDLDDSPLPLPRPPTPPNASHVTSSPAPAASHPPTKPPPPPRRQPHGRSDSKMSITGVPAATSSQPEETEPSPRRSSQESIRSRSSSLRVSIHAPAPPPPRRSIHGPPRPSNTFVSPSTVSFSSVTSTISERNPSGTPEFSPLPTQQLTPSDGTTGGTTSGLVATPGSSASPAADHAAPSLGHHSNHSYSKLSPPPPPPARNASVRSKRPPSISSLDATSRRVTVPGHSSMGPPPPPPPSRQRGSSKGSMDSAITVLPRRTSGDSVRVLPGILAEEPGPTVAETGQEDLGGEDAAATSANDILANLTALQREVDALRGRYEKEKGV